MKSVTPNQLREMLKNSDRKPINELEGLPARADQGSQQFVDAPPVRFNSRPLTFRLSGNVAVPQKEEEV